MNDIVTVSLVTLAGRYATYVINDQMGGGRYGTFDGQVYVANLATGHRSPSSLSGCCDPPTVLLSPQGIALWQVETEVSADPSPPSWFWSVNTLNGRTGKTTTLDTEPVPGQASPSPFTNLRLEICVVGGSAPGTTDAWWRFSGTWRTATVG